MTRLILAAVGVLAVSERTPVRAQHGHSPGPAHVHAGGSSFRSGVGFSAGTPSVRPSGLSTSGPIVRPNGFSAEPSFATSSARST